MRDMLHGLPLVVRMRWSFGRRLASAEI